MELLWTSGDETWALLGRMLVLTLFYAALVWLPIRIAGAVLRRMHEASAARRLQRHRPRRTETVYVIR